MEKKKVKSWPFLYQWRQIAIFPDLWLIPNKNHWESVVLVPAYWLMVMVPARNAGGTCQGRYTLSKAHRHFSHLRPALCLGWPLWFLRLQDALQQKPLENLEEQDVLLIGPGGHVPEPLPVRQRKRETMELRFYIYQVSSVLQGHSLSTNLKYQRRNWVKAGSTRLPKISWKKKIPGCG